MIPMRTRYLCLCLIFISQLGWGQSARQRSVEVSAVVQENPPRIDFSWPIDSTAAGYEVFRKTLEATDWGAPIANLEWMATSFSDTNIEVEEAFEYAFFKKQYDTVKDTVCIPAGTNVRFALSDMYGIGLCCNFGHGFYQLEACGEIVTEGSDFGFNTLFDFAVCDDGNGCTEVIITIAPDMFPNSTSWTLTDLDNSIELASSGFVGQFIAERARYGFIYAGIRAPALEDRGKILLLIDDEYTDALSAEIERLRTDLILDGWQVLIREANKNDAVTSVKATIQEVYSAHADLNSLFIIGHIPVPYSGDMYPDTHSENHQGAWSADTYYAELDGTWTDETADITTAFFERNHNTPGDGKFDQSAIPSGQVELAVGRVDFHNMPDFQADEIELTRQYLDKNHLWRNGMIAVERRALVDDNFGNAFAAPAASGWRNFAPLLGSDKTEALDYFSSLRDSSFLWSYGCGSGTHISSAGIGSTTDFANDSLLSIFTMLFGSQFGDWDNENNFLRAPLASGLTLTNVWAGNPAWYFHDMAMGYPIGHSVRRTQNSVLPGDLPGPQLVHTALLGDPSIRMHPVLPAENAEALFDGNVQLSWTASPDTDILGYYIYRSDSIDGPYQRISPEIVTDLFFEDMPGVNGFYHYMIRAVKLETSGSGTYLNLSPGIRTASDFLINTSSPQAADLQIYPNPASRTLFIEGDVFLRNGGQLELWDYRGQMVFKQQLDDKNQQEVVLPDLPNGIYIVHIFNKTQTRKKRIVLIN